MGTEAEGLYSVTVKMGEYKVSTTVISKTEKFRVNASGSAKAGEAAKKADYDKQSWALSSGDSRYEAEWKLYANGVSKDDIMELRDLSA